MTDTNNLQIITRNSGSDPPCLNEPNAEPTADVCRQEREFSIHTIQTLASLTTLLTAPEGAVATPANGKKPSQV